MWKLDSAVLASCYNHRTFIPNGTHNDQPWNGGWLTSVIVMTNVQVRAAVRAQETAKRQAKLVYRGVSYLKKS